jgi:uncharacterized protein YuzE
LPKESVANLSQVITIDKNFLTERISSLPLHILEQVEEGPCLALSLSCFLTVAWEEEMRLKIDKENDALYFRLDETEIVELEEVQPGVILDFNKDNYVVGIEILDLSTRTTPENLRVFQFETV